MGLLFSLFLLFFFPVCLILRSTPRSMRHMGKCGWEDPSAALPCSVSLQMQLKRIKTVSLSCRAHSHGHMKVKVTLAALFFFFFLMTALFWGFLFHLEEIFIVNPLPVARFEHAVPYVVFCLTTLLLKPRISDLSSWFAAQPDSLIQVGWWSLSVFN